ncbi:putative permease C29B12.14c [Pseudocercospora fuligena]|uniref:Putative permease C29B12.14c n=1 Tax=Pseudocercospora fuligena TaxID=685502 RepID=A0A8H6RIB9_9PEZI|nr:putative permease C29B12.14c [Pseudocercospora fuligena]
MSLGRLLRALEVKHRVDSFADRGVTRWGNKDIYPVIKAEQTFIWSDFYAYWMTSGISMSSWTLGSSLIGYGLTASQAIVAVLLGTLLASKNAFLCGEIGRDHHLGYTMMSRACWGLYGSYLGIFLSTMQCLIFFGVQAYFGGQAVVLWLSAIFPQFLRLKNTLPESSLITTQALLGFLLYFVFFTPIIFVRPHKLQKYLYCSVILITLTCFGVLAWAVHTNNGSVGNLVSSSIKISATERRYRMGLGICSVAGQYTGSSVRIADWTRFQKTRRASIPAMLTAMPIGITIGALLGVLTTSATLQIFDGELIWNPLIMLQKVQHENYTPTCRALTFFAGIGFTSSQVFINMTQNVVSAGMDLAGVLPKFLDIRRSGIVIKGIYWFHWCLNWRAFLVFFLCTAPSMPGFVVNINGNSIGKAWTRIYQVTWFFGYFSAALLYCSICKASPPPGLGVQEDMPEYIEGVVVTTEEIETVSTSEHKSKHAVEVSEPDVA